MQKPSTQVEKKCAHCSAVFIAKDNSLRLFCTDQCRRKKGRKNESVRPRIYRVWRGMKTRCFNAGVPNYKTYGGRGITVCQEWLNDFKAFEQWAFLNGYRDDLQIDRINNNGNYGPDNCRFVTRSQNNTNRRGNQSSSSKFKGISWLKKERRWTAQVSIGPKTKYLGSFKTQLAAALRYDDAAHESFGEFALLNFPERKRKVSG